MLIGGYSKRWPGTVRPELPCRLPRQRWLHGWSCTGPGSLSWLLTTIMGDSQTRRPAHARDPDFCWGLGPGFSGAPGDAMRAQGSPGQRSGWEEKVVPILRSDEVGLLPGEGTGENMLGSHGQEPNTRQFKQKRGSLPQHRGLSRATWLSASPLVPRLRFPCTGSLGGPLACVSSSWLLLARGSHASCLASL